MPKELGGQVAGAREVLALREAEEVQEQAVRQEERAEQALPVQEITKALPTIAAHEVERKEEHKMASKMVRPTRPEQEQTRRD